VTTFSFLTGLGASLGLWQITRNAQPQHVRRLVDYSLLLLLAAWLGAHAFFVALHGGYYSTHVLEAFYFWQGGLSWPGAAAGVLLALGAIALLKRRSLAWLADSLAPILGPLAVGAWLGCWQSGVAYGAALPAGTWWGVPAPDEAGVVSLRVPLQLGCALALLVYLWLVERGMAALVGRHHHPGLKSSLFGLGLGLDLLASSLLRVDPIPRWGSLGVDTWCALGLAGIGLVGIAVSFIHVSRFSGSIL
jgi:prolipoprotein diacylglyceryltransferase